MLRDLKPTDIICGYNVRPGHYDMEGATPLRHGVNFTISTAYGTSCTLLLFTPGARTPYVRLPFPESYRVGNTYSMIVYGLEYDKFEYAYSIDGPNDPRKGLIFDKSKYILDPYAKAVTGQSGWGKPQRDQCVYKARVVLNDYDWGNFKTKSTPLDTTASSSTITGATTPSASSHRTPAMSPLAATSTTAKAPSSRSSSAT